MVLLFYSTEYKDFTLTVGRLEAKNQTLVICSTPRTLQLQIVLIACAINIFPIFNTIVGGARWYFSVKCLNEYELGTRYASWASSSRVKSCKRCRVLHAYRIELPTSTTLLAQSPICSVSAGHTTLEADQCDESSLSL